MNYCSMESISMKSLIDMNDVNIMHQVIMTKKFLKKLIDKSLEHKCGIINVSSVMGITMCSGNSTYASGKHSLRYFTEAISEELKDNKNLEI